MNKLSRLLLIFLFFLSFLNVNSVVIGEDRSFLIENVVITNTNWADPIAATNYAYEINAVILQTEKNELNPKVSEILSIIKPKNIIIIGGEEAVSLDIETELKSYSEHVTRIGGQNRAKTVEKVLKIQNISKETCMVDGYNFSKTIEVSNDYVPVYGDILKLDPKNTIRTYGTDSVKIYEINGNSRVYIGTFKKSEVIELPKKILVFTKTVDSKYTNDDDIYRFGYYNAIYGKYNDGVIVTESTPTAYLLAKYLGSNVISSGNSMIYLQEDPIESSISTAVDILVLNRAREIYLRTGGEDISYAVAEAKTQLWAKKLPVDRYNIPDSCVISCIQNQ